MSFCTNCGKEIIEDAVFCDACGTPITTESVPEQELTAGNTETDDNLIKEEQEFLDATHRLLRWERKAWSITGKVFKILGIVCTALFALFFFLGMALSEPTLITTGLAYLFVFPMYIVIGIVQSKVADKIPLYTGTLYDNFTYANDRCGNVGMMVLSIVLGGVHTIFFIINFTRIKSSTAIINRILKRQGKI